MNILIIDPKCPKPYDNNSLKTGGLGGTESTIVKIANQLAENHTVVVTQHNRIESISPKKTLHFTNAAHENEYIKSPGVIIFIQKPQNVRQLVFKYPKARKILWLHNYIEDEVPLYLPDIALFNIEILCVSEVHKQHTLKKIKKSFISDLYFTYLHRLKVHYIYNPLDDDLIPDKTPVDFNKLVFFSSPYKGIENVIRLFSLVKKDKDFKELKLYVANPGYIRNFDTHSLDIEGIINLGSLPQQDAINHVRSALCVFYPQIRRPETFGLVYSEANAVGTPVLAHDFGSAREILSNQEQILDCSDDTKVINTLKSWYLKGQRPHVEANPQFRLSNVIKTWEKLISEN
jgi:glycosyltransferase involved in cell wall biosynthesis